MPPIAFLLSFTSLFILLAGAWAWRMTSSRSLLLNTVFGSTALLLAAYEVCIRTQPQWAVVLPFFTTMLFGGRALGLWWRSRKEQELLKPAQILGAIAALTLTSTVTAFCQFR